jgi:membrane fusion protein, multidrug efflux system
MDTLHSVTIIPSAAVQNGEKGSFVYVLKDDETVTVRPIKLGVVQGESVAVMEGLKAEELVVIDGTEKLREGAKVKRVTAGGSPPESPTEDKGSKRKHDK